MIFYFWVVLKMGGLPKVMLHISIRTPLKV